MSKKRRRKRDRKPNLPVESRTSTPQRASQPLRGAGDFNPDYTYVLEDLKRIGLLAGTFIALLIILSFFLR